MNFIDITSYSAQLILLRLFDANSQLWFFVCLLYSTLFSSPVHNNHHKIIIPFPLLPTTYLTIHEPRLFSLHPHQQHCHLYYSTGPSTLLTNDGTGSWFMTNNIPYTNNKTHHFAARFVFFNLSSPDSQLLQVHEKYRQRQFNSSEFFSSSPVPSCPDQSASIQLYSISWTSSQSIETSGRQYLIHISIPPMVIKMK